MKLIIHIGLVALALLILAKAVPGIVVDSLAVAIVAAIVLGFLNFFVRPLLVLLTLPVTILTLGLFIFIINTFIFAMTAWLVPGFFVEGFLAAFIGAVVVSAAGMLASSLAAE